MPRSESNKRPLDHESNALQLHYRVTMRTKGMENGEGMGGKGKKGRGGKEGREGRGPQGLVNILMSSDTHHVYRRAVPPAETTVPDRGAP